MAEGQSADGQSARKINPYREFIKTEGVPIVEAVGVECAEVALASWPRMGGLGAYVELAGHGDYASAYIAEIPPGQQLNPERHMHEEVIHVVGGWGATAVEMPDGKKHTFEWGAGSLFAIPLNAPHQHFNGSGSEPARFVAVTDLRFIMNLFHTPKFIYENPYVFRSRYGAQRYFQGEGELLARERRGHHNWVTNFVPDLAGFSLMDDWKERGAGGSVIFFVLADSHMHAHMSEFPVGTYKKAHRHGPGAHILCVSGHGYTLQYLGGQDPIQSVRTDWKPGTLFAVLDQHFHQHFNTAPQPSRYLALGAVGASIKYDVLETRRGDHEKVDTSLEAGGWQLEYEDEDPRILQTYEAELARYGVDSRMAAILGRG